MWVDSQCISRILKIPNANVTVKMFDDNGMSYFKG